MCRRVQLKSDDNPFRFSQNLMRFGALVFCTLNLAGLFDSIGSILQGIHPVRILKGY
jgi:hypothetical protein